MVKTSGVLLNNKRGSASTLVILLNELKKGLKFIKVSHSS